MQDRISLKDAAEYLGISMATVLNWEKLGYLKAIREDKRVFYQNTEIFATKDKIEKGLFEKLSKRANKTNSLKTFLPHEYINNPDELKHFTEILNLLNQVKADISESLFFLSVNLLMKKKLISSFNQDLITDISAYCSPNPHLLSELQNWASEISFNQENTFYTNLSSVEMPSCGDILGTVYQSLLTEGHKSREGSYYTPQIVTQKIVGDYITGEKINLKILDPCCGTGQFLLAAADCILKNNPNPDPANIWGYDIDPVAVRIARINLFLKFSDYVFIPNIYKKNIIFHYTLGDRSGIENDFDLVIGNPPWGADLKFEQTNFLKDNYPIILSLESFSYFIYIGLELLKKNGVLSFILPESITNIKTHKDIRAYLLRNSSISRIEQLGRIFRNVYTNVIRIDLVKEHLPAGIMQINAGGKNFSAPSERFNKNIDKIFDIYNTPEDQEIIRKAFDVPHSSLYHHSEWALGIVTGHNGLLIRNEPAKGFEPVFRGRDIQKFYFSKPTGFIQFIPANFQQVAPEEVFRSEEKLVYRFISNKLIVAYDDQQRLTLNSANIFIPRLKDYPVKVILALFNSSLYQFIFQKKFFTHKVLKSQLEQLPLPLWETQMFEQLIAIVNNLVIADLPEGERKYLNRLLDDLIFDFFSLTTAERETVLNR